MQIIMIAFRTRQGGRLPQALLSAGSTWHARPLAASVCTVVPAAAVATGYSRTFVRPMRRLTHQPQLETVGKRHPRSLTRQGFDASVFRKRGGNRDRGLLGVLYPERILRMIHTQNEGIYRALIAQLDKLARHNRQESYKTRQRYYEAMQRFCRFLAEEYRLQKLTNISGKHLVAYVRHLQENGKAASTIKTELAAIRFWHDQISNTKHKLPSNADLADQAPLERRKLQGIDRHWTPEQFTAFTSACREEGREDYAARVNEYYETLQWAGEEDGFYAMCFDEDVSLLEAPTISYGVAYDYSSQAQNLFDVLRQLDKLQATEVYVHAPEPEEMGLAVYNRLLRAAAFRVVHL